MNDNNGNKNQKSPNRNQSSKNRNNGAKNQQNKNQPNKNQQGAGRTRKKSRKKPRLDPVKYWGDPGALPVRNDYVLEGADPTAVVRSLGKAPIPGKNSAPELYFEVLYQRAAGLAHALSFAGGLNQDPDPVPVASSDGAGDDTDGSDGSDGSDRADD